MQQRSKAPSDGDYVSWSGHGAHAFARPYAADWLASILCSGQTLYDWAAQNSASALAHGRGAVYAVASPFPDRQGLLVVRHYNRGGLMAPLLRDRYLRIGSPRPEAEALISDEARRQGVSTPAVMAAAWYPTGAFYRGDLVTEMIPESRSLAELLFSGERSPDAQEALSLSGQLVHDLAAAGILHADLNAMNILLNRQAGELSAHVIDLDRSGLVRAGHGLSMLRRLERSLRKLGDTASRPLSTDDWRTLRSAAKVEE